MGCCTRRHFLLTICAFQLITIIERQVFDFLGFMWAPILANFFHIIFVIFGFFGCYQFRAKYLVTYAIWNVFWLGWNAFLVCFYLSVGILDKNSVFLNFGSVSWFESNGYGCQPVFSTNFTVELPVWPIRPERVDNCLLDYEYVEIAHSGVQLALSLLALLGAILMSKTFYDDDDRSIYKSTGNGGTAKSNKSKHRQSLYSIEFSPPLDTIRGSRRHMHQLHAMGAHHLQHSGDDLLEYDTTNDLGAMGGAPGVPPLSPKPMTPRRVKRRSVMTRGSSGRQSGSSARHGSTSTRQSQRASRRKHHQSTVTKLLEQQQLHQPPHQPPSNFQHNGAHSASQRRHHRSDHRAHAEPVHSQLTETNLKYLNTDVGAHQAPLPSPPDPIYYNMEPHQQQLQLHHQQQLMHASHMGHYNPTYQHSNPNLNAMPLDPPPPPDELLFAHHSEQPHHQHLSAYQPQRPPSVRSSYSNFHGARMLSGHAAGDSGENVFASLGSSHGRESVAAVQQQQYEMQQNMNLPPPPPPLASAMLPSGHGDGRAGSVSHSSNASPPIGAGAPYLPPRKTASRESIRFLNNGPPAYNLNYHTPPDSETTM